MRIKKKLLAAVLSAALACTYMPTQEIGMTNVFAEEEIASDFDIDENGVLKKYNGAGGDVVIPDGVKEIGNDAFIGCSRLTSIIIPKGVTSIGIGAFCDCMELTSITVDRENSIYDSREDCNAIIETESNTLIVGCKNTIIPKSVTLIGGAAFSGCSGLISFTIPEGVTSIGIDAFSHCKGLVSITIPESVTEIDDWAFWGCSSLTSITIPKSVTSIGGETFSYCSDLTSITVDRGNGIYDSREDCNAIIETENNRLIAGCKNTVIPRGVTEIGERAFSGCSGLTSITLPESVAEIGDFAFNGCSSLSTIKGKKGSYAQTYANGNGYDFVDIDDNTSGPSGDTTLDAGFLAGDADYNGTVNLDDAKIVLRLAVGIKPKNPVTEQGKKNSDYDKSGKVDLDDAKYTLKKAVGINFTL